jgi:serine/threonine protein kinase
MSALLAPAEDPLIGRTLNGRFRVLERIGVGGMGRVYKALQQPLDRLVAVKVLSPDYASGPDPDFKQRFFLEASLTSKLRHPNTVTVIDYGRTGDGVYYIAMEYLEGRTLGEVLRDRGPMPWRTVLLVAQQIGRSLREAHKAGIVHRDLKPGNVMLLDQEETEDPLVKVLDFGLVKSLRPEHQLDEGLTKAGIFLGSPQFMAPEQARNQVSIRSDIYSLGVTLFSALMGRPPFTGKESLEIILQHINDPPPRFADLRPELQIPAEVENLVRTCLEKDPARRFASMEEVLRATRRALGQTDGSGIFSGPHSFPPTSVVIPISPPRPKLIVIESPEPAATSAPTFPVDLAPAGVDTPRPSRIFTAVEPKQGNAFWKVVAFVGAVVVSFAIVFAVRGGLHPTAISAPVTATAPSADASPTVLPKPPALPEVSAASPPAPPAPVKTAASKPHRRTH